MNAANEESGATPHLGERVELHALGALEPHERLQVEAHVAGCAPCARALAAAEATVAALDDAFVRQSEPPARLAARLGASAKANPASAAPRFAARRARMRSRFYATAATLLIAVGAGGGALVERGLSDVAKARDAASDSAVLATLATSHFNHATLVARAPSTPVAKVLYARDGAWLYLIIDSAACACRVVARTATGARDLGAPAVRGTTSTLFARGAGRPQSIELVGLSGRVVSDVTLVYATR